MTKPKDDSCALCGGPATHLIKSSWLPDSEKSPVEVLRVCAKCAEEAWAKYERTFGDKD